MFHSFATEKEPFDKVRARKVARDGRVLDGEFVFLDAGTATYSIETPNMMLTKIAVDV